MIRMSDTGYPTKPSEGTLVVNNTNLGAYVNTPFTVSGLTKGRKYYFSAFPYSVQGVYNLSSNAANRADATPAAGEIAAISLRVCDRDNETWQMKQPLPEQAAGWITLRYQFRPGEGMKGGSWGPKEKKNGKFDWPISLSGFACSYRKAERLGVIGVGQIRVITP